MLCSPLLCSMRYNEPNVPLAREERDISMDHVIKEKNVTFAPFCALFLYSDFGNAILRLLLEVIWQASGITLLGKRGYVAHYFHINMRWESAIKRLTKFINFLQLYCQDITFIKGM